MQADRTRFVHVTNKSFQISKTHISSLAHHSSLHAHSPVSLASSPQYSVTLLFAKLATFFSCWLFAMFEFALLLDMCTFRSVHIVSHTFLASWLARQFASLFVIASLLVRASSLCTARLATRRSCFSFLFAFIACLAAAPSQQLSLWCRVAFSLQTVSKS